MITSEQIRAGLAALRWSQKHLQKESGVKEPTIRRLADGSGVPNTSAKFLGAIQKAMEKGGVTFLDENDQGEGIRYKGRKY